MPRTGHALTVCAASPGGSAKRRCQVLVPPNLFSWGRQKAYGDIKFVKGYVRVRIYFDPADVTPCFEAAWSRSNVHTDLGQSCGSLRAT